jgi:hypothetical protein
MPPTEAGSPPPGLLVAVFPLIIQSLIVAEVSTQSIAPLHCPVLSIILQPVRVGEPRARPIIPYTPVLFLIVQPLIVGEPPTVWIAPKNPSLLYITRSVIVGELVLHEIGAKSPNGALVIVNPDNTESGPSPLLNWNTLGSPAELIVQYSGPFSDRTVIAFPLKVNPEGGTG